MADKLDWLGRHLVLIRHLSLADVIAKEGYKIPPGMEDLFEGETHKNMKIINHEGHKGTLREEKSRNSSFLSPSSFVSFVSFVVKFLQIPIMACNNGNYGLYYPYH